MHYTSISNFIYVVNVQWNEEKTKLNQELGMTNNSYQFVIFKEQLYELMIFGSYACALDQT